MTFERYYLDLSREMLGACEDSGGASRIMGSALRMPFGAIVFDGVISFLGDAFNTSQYFEEAFRVLKSTGHLVHVVPSAEWGRSLRSQLGYSLHETVFVGRSGGKITAPSLLCGPEELESMAGRAGFKHVTVEALHATGQTTADLPRQIQIAVSALNIAASQLPILLVVRAKK